MPEPDLDDAIQENAQGPKKVEGDGISVEQHSIDDQIKADRYLNAKNASRSGTLGIRMFKISPPGTC